MTSIPNLITFGRLFGIPLLLLHMEFASHEELRYAAAFFLFLAVTDFLDGYLARRLHAVSDLGKLLDPLVDKLLIIAPLVALVGFRSEVTGSPWVPAWLVILLIARELWVTGIRGIAATRGVVIAADDFGKVKTTFQVAAVFFLILHQEKLFRLSDAWVTGEYLGLQCLITSLLIGYWGAIDYTARVFGKNNQ